jgi:hypothetical protein
MKASLRIIQVLALLFFSANSAVWAAEAGLPRPDHVVVVIEGNHNGRFQGPWRAAPSLKLREEIPNELEEN